ncbi:ABC transporter substrate-binding protein [Vibrio sp. SCSIO 43137]|uniref:ABC transporter substrate-binding protein n=1 Tax=Vibrio sp. SCSIO 43137 TaxID=3021011 RepID=UPI0023081435|nr:ABC transporter substrate-binding protein [Vibrio sp. SCSIO 43137]WCE28520.1 ABC transporter substrate-binding protein [Vibrio sp. SCSIO 43137]
MKKIALLTAALISFSSGAATEAEWQEIEQKAKGQTVYFHAWGGSQEINAYLKWTAEQLESKYDIDFKHVKVSDIAKTTAQLVAEKAAGKESSGSVDMVWINGENFKSMKNNDLLYGPFVNKLPSWKFVDKSLPVDSDFSEPTDGLEAPWGVGQLVFIHDTQTLNNPPASFSELLSYTKAYPGKISYPKPPQFHGTSFLKALLIELTNSDPSLYKQVNQKDFDIVTQPLWRYLDELHKNAWQQGKQFPSGSSEMIQLLDDRQLDLSITFNPNAVFSAQNSGKLAESTQAYAMEAGALSNIHFLAIPFNASAKEAALVSINFLLSPEAQSRKGDLSIWGDPSVLENQYLQGSAKNTRLFKSLPEPHPSWQVALERAWLERYGK